MSRVPRRETAVADASPRKHQTQNPVRAAIRGPALHTQVVDKLRRLIANGDIAAGERVNELQIAENFRVSRTPIREAVKLLASEGLLELSPGRGARVRRLSREEMLEHFEVIGALERHAVELAVGRMSEPERAEIVALHQGMKAAFAMADARSYFDLNQKMHRLFVRFAGNATLAAMHDAMTKRARRDRPLTLASPPRWSASMAEHDELVEAASRGDAARAGAAMLDHLRRTAEAIAEAAERDE
jgi:DNA-binding GntR family transcriptional regulator